MLPGLSRRFSITSEYCNRHGSIRRMAIGLLLILSWHGGTIKKWLNLYSAKLWQDHFEFLDQSDIDTAEDVFQQLVISAVLVELAGTDRGRQGEPTDRKAGPLGILPGLTCSRGLPALANRPGKGHCLLSVRLLQNAAAALPRWCRDRDRWCALKGNYLARHQVGGRASTVPVT